MKYYSNIIIFSFLAVMISCSQNNRNEHQDEHEHADEKELHEGHDKGEHGNHHGDEIELSPCVAERFGVKTDSIIPSDFSEVINVSGQIVPASGDISTISATTSGIVTLAPGINIGKRIGAGTTIASISSKGVSGGDADNAARIARDAARRELDRITPLYKDGIVSEKDYNMARQTYDAAVAAYSAPAASGVASSRTGGVITQLLAQSGQYVETGAPIAVVSQNTRLTLRADLPEKYYNILPTIMSANFKPTYSDRYISMEEVGGRLMSTPSSSTTQGGYIPVYFTFENNGQAVPGAFAEISLIGSRRHDVISLPIESLIEQQGAFYVYVKVHDGAFEKRRVIIGDNDGRKVEIRSGVNKGDNVVVAGAQVVRMAESSGAVPEGHSHNH